MLKQLTKISTPRDKSDRIRWKKPQFCKISKFGIISKEKGIIGRREF